MPTRAQVEVKMNQIREGVAPTFVEGTETNYPNRAEKRRLARITRHAQALKMRKVLDNG